MITALLSKMVCKSLVIPVNVMRKEADSAHIRSHYPYMNEIRDADGSSTVKTVTFEEDARNIFPLKLSTQAYRKLSPESTGIEYRSSRLYLKLF